MYYEVMRNGLLWSIFIFIGITASIAQEGLVINEVGTGSDKYIELVVVGDPCEYVNLQGWVIDDNNGIFTDCGEALAGTGVSSGHIRFANSLTWAAIPVGTIILINNDSSPLDGVFCEDYYIQVNFESEDDFFSPLFEKNTSVPRVSNSSNECDNQDCNNNNGDYRYSGGAYSAVTGNFLMDNSQVAINNQKDGIQTRTPSFAFFNGFAWGVGNHPPCGASDPVMGGGPNNMLFPAADYFAFGNIINDNIEDINNWTIGNDTPGEANSLENANWIANMRRPLEAPFRNIDCDPSEIGQITIPISDENDCSPDVFDIGFSTCNIYEYYWTVDDPEILELLSEPEDDNYAYVQGLKKGTTYLRMQITDDFLDLYPPEDHDFYQETFLWEVTVESFDASFQANFSELCEYNCQEIQFIVDENDPGETYYVEFYLDPYDDFSIDAIPGNQIIQVCMDSEFPDPDYDEVNHILHLPLEDAGETISMQLQMSAQNSNDYCGVVDDNSVVFELINGISPNPAPLITGQANPGITSVDLTVAEDSISNGTSAFNWYADSLGFDIIDPTMYLTNQLLDTVFVQVLDGPCSSTIMPVIIQLRPDVSGKFDFGLDTLISVCDGDGTGLDTTFTIFSPDTINTFEYNLVMIIDGDTLITRNTGMDSMVVQLMDVIDSAIVYVDSVIVNGGGDVFTGINDTIRIYVNNPIDLSMIPEIITECDFFVIPNYTPGFDSLLILQNSTNQSVLPGDTVFSLDFLVYSYDIGGCFDLVIQDVFIDQPLSAGEGKDSTLCLSALADSLGLFEFLTSNYDGGGLWEQKSGPAVNISSVNKISASDMVEGVYAFQYIIGGNSCTPDTACFELIIEGESNPGMDTTYSTSIEVLDLYSFFPTRNDDGLFILEGVLVGSMISTDTLSPGTYTITHEIQNPVCGNRVANLDLTIVPCAVSGLDTTINTCEELRIVPLELLRDATNGGDFIYNGAMIPGTDSLDITSVGINSILYVVDGGLGCNPSEDTATITVSIVETPTAGQNTAYETSIEILDLFSFFPNRNADGVFLLNGVPVNPMISTDTLLPGTYTITHMIQNPVCGNSTANLDLTIIPCAVLGLDTTINACEELKIVPLELLRDATNGGAFIYNGAMIPGTDSLDITSVGINSILYVVDGGLGCNPSEDTATITVSIVETPTAGQDTAYETSVEILDLFSFFPDRNEDGVFLLNGIPVSAMISTDTLLPGMYTITHEIQNPVCGNSAANLNLTIIPCVVAGLDTTIIACGNIIVMPEELVRNASDQGSFLYNGLEVSADNPLDINSVGVNFIQFIAESGTGCDLDTAIFSITILPEPNAGRDTMAMLIDGVIDLYSFFPGRSGDGYFFFTNNPSGVIANDLDIGALAQGNYDIGHVVEDVFCPADTAYLQLEVVSCLSAGMNTMIQTCRNQLIDLTSLASPGSGKRYYTEGMEILVPSVFDPFTFFGDIAIIEVVQTNSGCADDTIFIEINVDDPVTLPSDVFVTRCGSITTTLEALTQSIPIFDPDHFAYGAIDNIDVNGDTILAATPLDLFEPVTVLPGERRTLSFIVRPLYCPADTVHYTIIPGAVPNAGQDTSILVCRNTNIDLTSLSIQPSNNNYFFEGELVSDPSNFELQSILDEDVDILVVQSSQDCGSDTANINIRIEDLIDLPQDTTIINCGGFTYVPLNTFQNDLGIETTQILSGALDSILTDGDTILAAITYDIDPMSPPIIIDEGETRTFSYIVETENCGADTLHHRLVSVVSNYAGQDTTVILSNSSINLFSLVPERSKDGNFEVANSGIPISNIFDPKAYNLENISIFHITESSNCQNDTARIDLVIVPCIGAGLDSTLMDCGSFAFRPVTLLRNSGAGNFYREGMVIPPSGLITINDSENIELFYVTMNDLCPADTARFIIQSIPLADAGRDTSIVLCNGNVTLGSLIETGVSGGRIENELGQLMATDAVFDANQGIGNYAFYYIVQSAMCPEDTARYSITVSDEPSAGLDTVIVSCGMGTIIPQQYIRNGVSGIFEFENRIIPGDTVLVFEGAVNTTIRHYINGTSGCGSDTAYYQVVNIENPNAGLGYDTTICDSETINLSSLVQNGDKGGTFYNENNDVIDTLYLIDYFGSQRVRYVVDNGLCGTDNATYLIESYALNRTNIEGVSGSICALESMAVRLPELEGITTFELTILKIDRTNGATEENIVIVNPGSVLNFYHTSGGIDPFFDLENGIDYSIVFDKAMFRNGCEVMTNWDTIEISTAVSSESIYTETLCSGEERLIGGMVFNEVNPSGTIILENASSNGCDSIIIVDLDFDFFTYGNYQGQLCEGEEVVINGTLYNAANLSGVDTLSGASENGCDSIVTLNFSIVDTKIERIENTYCGEEGTVIVNGVTYDFNNPQGMEMIQSGSSSGCDSVVEVNLIFLPVALNDINLGVCNTDFSTTINGTLYNFENRRGLDVLPGAAANGCDSIIDVNLTFVELAYTYEVLSPPCPGDSIGRVEITDWDGSLPATISWDNNEIQVTELPFSFDFPINVPILLEIRDDDECNGTQFVTIMEREPIETDLVSTPLGGNTYDLMVESTDEIAEYIWYPQANLSCTDCPNPQITLTEVDQYLYVDMITTAGCMVSDTVYLAFNEEEVVYTPIIFSPNQDGNNDTWTLYASPATELIFKNINIYDRWGKLVTILPPEAINNPNLGWDGGEHLPGVYVYRLEYEDRSGQSRVYIGDFTLIR